MPLVLEAGPLDLDQVFLDEELLNLPGPASSLYPTGRSFRGSPWRVRDVLVRWGLRGTSRE